MVNYAMVLTGLKIFLMGCLASIIVWHIGTNLLDATTTAGDDGALDTTEQAIVWIAMIIIWVLTIVILPAHFVIEGLKDQTGEG